MKTMNLGIELKNSNEDRLLLLCQDIVADDVSRERLKRQAETYLTLLKLEKNEKQKQQRSNS
tara:strand:+ start:30 stop:215 length:186 start_codon:yes stop_codon:yes gene_type:complete